MALDPVLVIAQELSLAERGVRAVVELLAGGATVPFIARYRKEATGGLDDNQLRELEVRVVYLRELQLARSYGGLAQLNHPNFRWGADAATVTELARKGVRFLEIAAVGFRLVAAVCLSFRIVRSLQEFAGVTSPREGALQWRYAPG